MSSLVRGAELGYSEADLRQLRAMVGEGAVENPRDICRILDNLKYLDDWRSDYRIQSVRSSLQSGIITCIDGAILSYGLLELFFPEIQRRLLALHRRDPKKDEECGHCVALYWTPEGQVGAFSKSSFVGLGHREPVFPDELSIATSYAEAYVAMGVRASVLRGDDARGGRSRPRLAVSPRSAQRDLGAVASELRVRLQGREGSG